MKKYLLAGASIVLVSLVLIQTYFKGDSPADKVQATVSAGPNQSNDDALIANIENSINEPLQQSIKTKLTSKQNMYSWISSLRGFENSVPIAEEEFEEYEQWLNDTGVFIEDLKKSDYASYDKRTLYALVGQGDLKAFEMLNRMPTYDNAPGETENLNRLGLILGSNDSPYGLAGEMGRNADNAYESGDYEAYRGYFAERLAMYEFGKMRGRTLPPVAMDRLLDSYKLDDDVEKLQRQAQLRSLEILNEVNGIREQKGWDSLSTDLPAGVLRQQAALGCRGDKDCIRQYVPQEYLSE